MSALVLAVALLATPGPQCIDVDGDGSPDSLMCHEELMPAHRPGSPEAGTPAPSRAPDKPRRTSAPRKPRATKATAAAEVLVPSLNSSATLSVAAPRPPPPTPLEPIPTPDPPPLLIETIEVERIVEVEVPMEMEVEGAVVVEDWHSVDRILNVPLSRPVEAGRLQFAVLHRAQVPLSQDTLAQFAGLDGGLRVGLQLRLGLLPGLDVGVFRTNGLAEPFDVYELDLKAAVIQGRGFSAGIRAGTSIFYSPVSTAAGWFVVFGIDKQWDAPRVIATVNTSYHQDSTGSQKSTSDIDGTCTLAGGLEFGVTESMSIAADTLVAMVGFANPHPVVSAGVKWRSFRHVFALMASNTSQVSLDGLIANTERPFTLDAWALGFTISREWDLWTPN